MLHMYNSRNKSIELLKTAPSTQIRKQKRNENKQANKQNERRDGFRSFQFNSIRLNYVNEIIVCKTEFLPIFHCINDCYGCVCGARCVHSISIETKHIHTQYTYIYIHFIPTAREHLITTRHSNHRTVWAQQWLLLMLVQLVVWRALLNDLSVSFVFIKSLVMFETGKYGKGDREGRKGGLKLWNNWPTLHVNEENEINILLCVHCTNTRTHKQ